MLKSTIHNIHSKKAVEIVYNVLYSYELIFCIDFFFNRCFTCILNFALHCVLGLTEMSLKLMDNVLPKNYLCVCIYIYIYIYMQQFFLVFESDWLEECDIQMISAVLLSPVKMSSRLKQDRNMHRSRLFISENSSKQTWRWIWCERTIGDGLILQRKS